MKRTNLMVVAAAGLAMVAAATSVARVSAQNIPSKPVGYADRLYVLDGGMGRSADASAWTNMLYPPNTPIDIAAWSHLIKHGDSWMLFDTSTNDGYVKLSDPGGNGLRWIKKESQTLPPQLKAVGITGDDIKYIGISHSHPDHIGNVEQFKKAEVLIQEREYNSTFANGNGPTGGPAYAGPVMEKDHPHKLLQGDYDVFGDGSVILFYTGGHTPGSQVCLVRLKNTGYVLLSGDAVHLRSNFDTRRIPRFGGATPENDWLLSVPAAFARVEALLKFYKAQLWVHHDFEDYKGRKLAPKYYD